MIDEPTGPDPLATGSEYFRKQVRDSCRKASEFADRIERGEPAKVLPLVRRLWIEAELPSYCQESWSRLWSAVRSTDDPSRVMSGKERRRLAALPDPVTAYRGARAGGERGWSWTLTRSIAVEFAVRDEQPDDEAGVARVCTAPVPKTDIIALFQLGGEDELIVDPSTLDWGAVSIEKL